MNENIYEKLKEINWENFLFLLFATSALIDTLANEDIKRSYMDGNGKENARKKFILASCLIIFVFAFFAYRNYNNLKKYSYNSYEYKLAYYRFIGTIFIVIGELVILYYFINTEELNNRN